MAHSLSLVEWWDEHQLWWDGRKAAELEQAGEQRLTICAKNWAYEMKELYSGLSAVAPDRLLELRYEELLANPVTELGKILEFLGLSLQSEYQKAIELLRLTNRPAAWSNRWTADQLESVLSVEQSLLDELGYI